MTLRLPIAVFFLASASISYSQDAPAAPKARKAPAKLDLSKFPGQFVDKVVVPVPAEVFAVLDKLDEPNWTGEIRLPKEGQNISKDRVVLALKFGSTVAEGFVAVQAKQSDKIQDVGRRALKLGDSLGVSESVQPHSQSIIESAGKEDWKKVREELDRTQVTVKTTMESLRDEDLSNLISLGGWIRGTNALTSLISSSYSIDKAELLNQPDLVAHFRKTINGMADPVKNHGEVKSLSAGLTEIEKLLRDGDSGISAEVVIQVRDSCRKMLNRFYFETEETSGGSGGANNN